MKITDEQIRESLKRKGGYVSQTAEELKVTPQAIYYRLKKNPELAEELLMIMEENLDFAESKLMEAIGKGEAWAVCFHLKCKGKHRGWVERTEVTGGQGGPIDLNVATKTLADVVRDANKEGEEEMGDSLSERSTSDKPDNLGTPAAVE